MGERVGPFRPPGEGDEVGVPEAAEAPHLRPERRGVRHRKFPQEHRPPVPRRQPQDPSLVRQGFPFRADLSGYTWYWMCKGFLSVGGENKLRL